MLALATLKQVMEEKASSSLFSCVLVVSCLSCFAFCCFLPLMRLCKHAHMFDNAQLRLFYP